MSTWDGMEKVARERVLSVLDTLRSAVADGNVFSFKVSWEGTPTAPVIEVCPLHKLTLSFEKLEGDKCG